MISRSRRTSVSAINLWVGFFNEKFGIICTFSSSCMRSGMNVMLERRFERHCVLIMETQGHADWHTPAIGRTAARLCTGRSRDDAGVVGAASARTGQPLCARAHAPGVRCTASTDRRARAGTCAHGQQWRTLTWREGTNTPLRSGVARVRVRTAQTNRPCAAEWLLIERLVADPSQSMTGSRHCRRAHAVEQDEVVGPGKHNLRFLTQ